MPNHTRAVRAGLLILGLCSVLDIAVVGVPDGPPIAIGVASAVLGLASLWLVVRALRDPGQSIRLLAALRIVSAASAVPGFFAGDVSGAAVSAAVVTVVLNVGGVALVAGSGRSAVVAR